MLVNGAIGYSGRVSLSEPKTIESNTLYLVGDWDIAPEFSQNASKQSKIIFRYHAKNVFIVAGSPVGARMSVLIDGKPVGSRAGNDVNADGIVEIKDERLYHLIQDSEYGEHTLELIIENVGLQAFTFTFG